MRDEMRSPAKIVSEILLKLAEFAEVGRSTFDLECIAASEIKKHGVWSFNKGFMPIWTNNPYPFVSCLSVNEVFVHGFPSENIVLKKGDIINIDLGIIDKDGNCGD